VYGCAPADVARRHGSRPRTSAGAPPAQRFRRARCRSSRTLSPGLGRSDTPLLPDLEASGWTSVVEALQRDPAFAGAADLGTDVADETGPLARLSATSA
jgi:hypothetical protein